MDCTQGRKTPLILGHKKEALEALVRLSGRHVRDEYNFTFAEVFEAWKPRTKTPHSTRVTCTTTVIDGGIQPAALQKVLGHADFSTTQKHYNKPYADALVKAVNKASRRKKAKK